MDRIYLDHAATTRVRDEVAEAIAPYFTETFGNASSVHGFGQDAKKALEESRRTVAEIIGAAPKEIYFTSGGTEADNMALKGVMYAHRDRGKHLITSSIEHLAVLNTARYLEEEGYEATYLPVDEQGVVDLDVLEDALREDTVLVSVMLANNETGVIQPVKDIAELADRHGALVHTDAVQAMGKIPVNVDDLGVDLLSISGHKFHGPKGVGALYARRGTKFDAILHGGHHERHRRPGTENVPGVVGMARALSLAVEEMDETMPRVQGLRARLQRGIQENIEDVYLNGHPEKRLPNTLNMSFEYVEGESLLLTLDSKGIAVSTGSACTSGSLEPSHVLKAMDIPTAIAHGSLRFSLGRANTQEHIDFVIETLTQAVERLRQMSPLYAEREEQLQDE